MADRKITDLTALAAGSQATGDLLTIVDVSEGAAADKNKKITVESLFKGIPSNVGIGTSAPSSPLHVKNTGSTACRFILENTGSASDDSTQIWSQNNDLAFNTNDSERMRIDSSGLVGIGESSPTQMLVIRKDSASTSAGQYPVIDLRNDNASGFSQIRFMEGGTENASIISSNASNDLRFRTNGANERMRITSDGDLLIGQTSTDTPGFGNTTLGAAFENLGADGVAFFASRSNNICAGFNRAQDGAIVQFASAGNVEGTISISGSTTSYNGAHLSRWSQLAGGAERTEILRGSVLSNLDEMCEWGEEDNEQLNRMKVSDVEGDVNVSGVFQAWDDDDDTYTNDFYCAMTGDFVIRIAQGTTVARGDLLMSAGDGTAKPKDGDIVRSKTIAKVTSTTVSTTYADGSYCVPCVLMAC